MNKKRRTRVSDLIHQHADEIYVCGGDAIRAAAVGDIRYLLDAKVNYTVWDQTTREVGDLLNRSLENVVDEHNSTLGV